MLIPKPHAHSSNGKCLNRISPPRLVRRPLIHTHSSIRIRKSCFLRVGCSAFVFPTRTAIHLCVRRSQHRQLPIYFGPRLSQFTAWFILRAGGNETSERARTSCIHALILDLLVSTHVFAISILGIGIGAYRFIIIPSHFLPVHGFALSL
jgi:hypothetical protein